MITKDEFIAYEKVRQSGKTNMLDTKVVSALSGLERRTIVEIIQSYSRLCKRYPDVRETNWNEV